VPRPTPAKLYNPETSENTVKNIVRSDFETNSVPFSFEKPDN